MNETIAIFFLVYSKNKKYSLVFWYYLRTNFFFHGNRIERVHFPKSLRKWGSIYLIWEVSTIMVRNHTYSFYIKLFTDRLTVFTKNPWYKWRLNYHFGQVDAHLQYLLFPSRPFPLMDCPGKNFVLFIGLRELRFTITQVFYLSKLCQSRKFCILRLILSNIFTYS